MKKIKFNVARAKTDHLIQQGNKVVYHLTDNPDFQNPSPSLDDFDAAIVDLSEKYTEAQKGAKLAIEIFKNARTDFRNMMRKMINYVNSVACTQKERCAEIIL